MFVYLLSRVLPFSNNNNFESELAWKPILHNLCTHSFMLMWICFEFFYFSFNNDNYMGSWILLGNFFFLTFFRSIDFGGTFLTSFWNFPVNWKPPPPPLSSSLWDILCCSRWKNVSFCLFVRYTGKWVGWEISGSILHKMERKMRIRCIFILSKLFLEILLLLWNCGKTQLKGSFFFFFLFVCQSIS